MPRPKPSFVHAINRAHRRATGLMLAAPFHEGGGAALLDAVSGRNGALHSNMTPDSDWVGSEYGWALDFDQALDRVLCGNPGAMLGEVTVAALLRPAVASGTQIIAAKATNTGSTGQEWDFEFGRTSGKLSLVWANSIIGTSSTALPVGSWYRVGFTRAGVTGAWTWTFFVDGKPDGTGSATANPGGNGVVEFGSLLNGLAFFLAGRLAEVSVWERALSPEEMAEDALDPFDIYRVQPSILRAAQSPLLKRMHTEGLFVGAAA